MLIHNKVDYSRKKLRKQLEREKLAKEHKKIKKPQKMETCHVNELWWFNNLCNREYIRTISTFRSQMKCQTYENQH